MGRGLKEVRKHERNRGMWDGGRERMREFLEKHEELTSHYY